MQFKHPEILWALLLLLIPILIHLLRLRRFKKTPFTNVAMLQKVISESKKSKNLKKWLLLLTRLALLTALVLAFAQPFTAKQDALKERETVIYLDNSFSMEAKQGGISLLEKFVQEFVQEVPKSTVFSLFTNDRTFRDVSVEQIQNQLLDIEGTQKQLTLEKIALKARTFFSDAENTAKDLVVISDFQDYLGDQIDLMETIDLHTIQLLPDLRNNIFIDSIYLGAKDGNQLPLYVQISGLRQDETTAISLLNNGKLIAKTAAKGTSAPSTTSILSLEAGQVLKGKIVIEDPVLQYDNVFNFNIDERNNPKILAISEEDDGFLNKLFNNGEFDFEKSELDNLNYSLIGSQNAVILNGLSNIPSSLSTAIKSLVQDGGSLIVIPPTDEMVLNSYNALFQGIANVRWNTKVRNSQEISKISFQHPIFNNVFEKQVTNFDYPKVESYFSVATNMSSALSFVDGSPFLISNSKVHVFTASLSRENSNFISSPLIVPTFYNFGELSLKNPSLYQTIGSPQSVDIDHSLGQDKIVKLKSGDSEFIPLQQSFSNKVQLNFNENPTKDGIYAILDGNDTLQNISFNYNRKESRLNYLDPNVLQPSSTNNTISSLFTQMAKDSSINHYWKWFVTFALFCVLLELLIQKLFP